MTLNVSFVHDTSERDVRLQSRRVFVLQSREGTTGMQMTRMPEYPIEPLFIERWSPRAYDANPVPEQDILTVLEAARWAPSAHNIQPWRFL